MCWTSPCSPCAIHVEETSSAVQARNMVIHNAEITILLHVAQDPSSSTGQWWSLRDGARQEHNPSMNFPLQPVNHDIANCTVKLNDSELEKLPLSHAVHGREGMWTRAEKVSKLKPWGKPVSIGSSAARAAFSTPHSIKGVQGLACHHKGIKEW